MDIKKIVEDVIKDFNRENERKLTYDKVGDTLVSQIECIEKNLEPGNVYALCNRCLYCVLLGSEDNLVNIENKKELTAFVKKSLEDAQRLGVSIYRWRPEILERVYGLGLEIFDIAKKAYFIMEPEESKDKEMKEADNLYSQMLAVKEELDFLEYVYASKEEILKLYEDELSESTSDLNTIKGRVPNKQSLRFSKFIHEREEIGMETLFC